jgi:O-antigen ligase
MQFDHRSEPHFPVHSAPIGSGGSQAGAIVAIVFGVLLGVVSWLLMGRTGLGTVMALLGVTVAGSVLSYLSWQRLAFLVALWLFAMSGFRSYAMIYMPVLPDVSIERILALWVLVLFALRLLMRRDTIRGPFALDVILLFHTMYILANVMYIGDRVHAHEWAISSVSPFIAYLIGKNVMNKEANVRYLFIFFFIVTIYYSTQSIAEKFDLNFLVWPKAILDPSRGLWPAGRSRGPFLHPPLFGQMIGMFMLVQFYFFYRVKVRALRTAILISILMSGLALLYTYTRAPWVAAAAGIITLAVLRPRFRQIIGAVAVIVALTLFVGVIQAATDQELLTKRVGDMQTIDNRLAAMSAALRMWRDHPLFGIGFFNWDSFYDLYRRGEEIPLYGYVDRYAGRGVVIHDIYWGRLAEEGIFSLGLLVAAATMVYVRFRKLWRRVADTDVLNRDGLAVMAGIFVCYLVGGLAIDYRYFDLVNAVPYMLAGILYGYRIPDHPPPPAPYRLWTPPYFSRSTDQDDATASQL